jgi:hypothetical protein
VTTDSVDRLGDISTSLARLAQRRTPTVRIVYDDPDPAASYEDATVALSDVAYVMGEVMDSYYLQRRDCRSMGFEQRLDDYLDNAVLLEHVDIWEIGNEVNGEWLCRGNTDDVYWTVRKAYDKVKSKGKATALTLFWYSAECASAAHEMLNWVDRHVEPDIRQGLDYVLVSNYETACPPPADHDWSHVFRALGDRFPNAYLGFGEVGTEDEHAADGTKETILYRYYGMAPMHPRFVGGYFWWYFRQDMVPWTAPLWTALNQYAASWDSYAWGQ